MENFTIYVINLLHHCKDFDFYSEYQGMPLKFAIKGKRDVT